MFKYLPATKEKPDTEVFLGASITSVFFIICLTLDGTSPPIFFNS